MHIEELRDYCLSKPYVSEELPFGPDTLVFKLAGKVFALIGLNQIDSLCFNVKCDPEKALTLRASYPETVLPGYHMNKKHWNTVYCNQALADEALFALLDHSYDLVFQGLPKTLRESLLK